MLAKFEKTVQAKMAEDLQKHTDLMKKDLIAAITQSVIQQLDGAVVQSFQTTNAFPAPALTKTNSDPQYASRCMNHCLLAC